MFQRITLIVACLATFIAFPSPVQATEPICFDRIPHCVDEQFAAFWQRNDSHAISGQTGNALRLFGHPIGPARIQSADGVAVVAQPFTNVILQQPLGNTDPARVTLQPVGLERLNQLGRAPALPATPPKTVPIGCRLFLETGYTLCNEFRTFWESNGLNLDNQRGYTDSERLALWGMPVSDVKRELAANSSNKYYLTQWFERARFQIDGATRQIIVTPLGREVMDHRPDLPPLPRNSGVLLSATAIAPGSVVAARASGFTNDSSVSITIFRADGRSIPAADQHSISAGGVTDIFCASIPDDALHGIWAIAFDGMESRRQAIGFFRVTSAEKQRRDCVDPIPAAPLNR